MVQTTELCSLWSLLSWQTFLASEAVRGAKYLMAWSPLNSCLLSSELKPRDAMKHQQQHSTEGETIFNYYFICYNVKFFNVKIFPQLIFMKISAYPVLYLFFSIPGWTNQSCVHRSYICTLYAHLGTLQPLSMSEVNVELLVQLLSLSIFFFHSSFLFVIFGLQNILVL